MILVEMILMGYKSLLVSRFAKVVVILTFVLSYSSCDKEDTSEFVSQAEIVAEYVRAEDYMADLFGLLHSSIYDTTLVNNGQGLIDSTYVSYQLDSVTGIGTFFYDFDSPNQPQGTANNYSGQVTAKLYQPFENEGALMQATFNNYVVNGFLLQGLLNYQNTGEFVADSKKYMLQYQLDVIWNEQKLLSFNPARNLYWSEGFDTPMDVQDDEFLLNEGADAMYFNPSDPQSVVPVNVVFTNDWAIGISCFRYFRNGNFEATVGDENPANILNGDFIDADYDNCADKVMIKNSDNSLGYPYYL